MESIHKTVLLNEVIEGLNLEGKSTVLDGTLGGGGHTALICEKYPYIKIITIDQDALTLKKARDRFQNSKCEINFINDNFRNLDKVLQKESGVDGIILDLGLSSDQLENSGRGFSFMKDEPLLMTMKENPHPEDITAKDVVNTWEEKSLADIIYGYGEERFAKRIARGIVEAREKSEIKTTFDLVKIINLAVPKIYKNGKPSKIHLATKTFQALRIAVNDELGALREGLMKGLNVLNIGGRMAVISFHSLEDRIVKRFYKEKEKEGVVKLINKKPIEANREEVINNNRSRSAKLRILEKI